MFKFFSLWLYILTDIKSGVFVLMLLTCVTKALLRATGVISEDRETKLETSQDVWSIHTTNVDCWWLSKVLQTDIQSLSGTFECCKSGILPIAACAIYTLKENDANTKCCRPINNQGLNVSFYSKSFCAILQPASLSVKLSNVDYSRVAAATQYRGCQICMVQVPASSMSQHLQDCSLRCWNGKLD